MAYQVKLCEQQAPSPASTPAPPTDMSFETFKDLLEAFPDIARMLLRGQLGAPAKGESGVHRYERLLHRDALERDFPNVAANVSLRAALGPAAAQALLRLQVIESGVSR